MRITDILRTEHTVFVAAFDQIEQMLPQLQTLAEVKLIGRLLEPLLHQHGEKEENLAYSALIHILTEKQPFERLHLDHQEKSDLLAQLAVAPDITEARHLLRTAIVMLRVHFLYEDQVAFPLMEKALQKESLETLGNA
ncbi:MAG: hemerythrin domain-containing protein [Verrucomicrobia bacterium]|nr:hemerythrin domain-containing protein [Verrucomicrobiota bacterium]